MKRLTVITLLGSKEVVNKIYHSVEPFIEHHWKKKYLYKGGGLLNIPIENNEYLFNYIVQIANQYKINLRFFQDTYYNKSEMEEVSLFQMKIPLITEFEGTDAKDYGTIFSDGCKICGIGAKLKSDLIIDKKLLKKYDIGNANPCIFVSERLRNIISGNNFTGISFNHAVRDFKGRNMNNYYVMDIENILPKMNSATWLMKGSVKSCGHYTIYLQSDIKYDEKVLEHINDFNLSYEYVNNFRLQQLIVSASVRDVFKQNKIYAGFVPVYIGSDYGNRMPSNKQS